MKNRTGCYARHLLRRSASTASSGQHRRAPLMEVRNHNNFFFGGGTWYRFAVATDERQRLTCVAATAPVMKIQLIARRQLLPSQQHCICLPEADCGREDRYSMIHRGLPFASMTAVSWSHQYPEKTNADIVQKQDEVGISRAKWHLGIDNPYACSLAWLAASSG